MTRSRGLRASTEPGSSSHPAPPYGLLLRGRLPPQTVNQPRRSRSTTFASSRLSKHPGEGRGAQDGNVPSPLRRDEPVATRAARARARALKVRAGAVRLAPLPARAETSSAPTPCSGGVWPGQPVLWQQWVRDGWEMVP